MDPPQRPLGKGGCSCGGDGDDDDSGIVVVAVVVECVCCFQSVRTARDATSHLQIMMVAIGDDVLVESSIGRGAVLLYVVYSS